MELQGPADLVIEIVSRDSNKRDKKDKYREYEQGGVREYWIIDPIRQTADFSLLGVNHQYRRIAEDSEGVIRSVILPGVWLKVGWLWQNPLPGIATVLKQWGI
jgi:Uma2 family endonuclease